MPGRVEIEDVADALDVEPARGDVGGDEDVDLTALEQIEFGEPLRLFHVAVDLAGLETRALEALVQLAHGRLAVAEDRSEEHTSELQSLMRISYAVFCLKKKNKII